MCVWLREVVSWPAWCVSVWLKREGFSGGSDGYTGLETYKT